MKTILTELRRMFNPQLRGEIIRRAKARRRCWPKEQHKTQGAAEAQLRSITRRGLEKDLDRIHTYYCPTCHTWHVGHGRA